VLPTFFAKFRPEENTMAQKILAHVRAFALAAVLRVRAFVLAHPRPFWIAAGVAAFAAGAVLARACS
jgi:hypothetical protein